MNTALTPPSWAGVAATQRLMDGDQVELLRLLLLLSRRWMQAAGPLLQWRQRMAMTDALASEWNSRPRTTEQRALLAAGCDLFDLVASTPQGWQALLDLGFDVVQQEPKSE
ncbi:MAG: hypothetical protein PGN26_14435 [Xylophilus ampelinus]